MNDQIEKMEILKKTYKIIGLLFVLLIYTIGVNGQELNKKENIILIPLDDRPPCLQLPVQMGKIADFKIITPPIKMLGKYTTAGDSDKIITWLLNQDLDKVDAVIVSIDMLSYGGLVASRVHQIEKQQAIERMNSLKTLKEKRPNLPIYANNVIMRLAPTVSENNERYRTQLAEWAEISVDKSTKAKKRTKKLEETIPSQVLSHYKKARNRNSQVNLKAIDLVNDRIIDYLVFSQDDAKPAGVHIKERHKLHSKINKKNLNKKVTIQPGADEMSMLLLARLLNKKIKPPKVKLIYSSKAMSEEVMAFEDRPLKQTAMAYIKTAGGQLVDDEDDQADLFFYVYTSRKEKEMGGKFAKTIKNGLKKGQHIVVADIDPIGNIQGGDMFFTKALEKEMVLPFLYGYASWNTAGNTIGTALSQGFVYNYSTLISEDNKPGKKRMERAQSWFIFHGVLNDFYYNNLVRKALLSKERNIHWSTILSDSQTSRMETVGKKLMQENLDQLYHEFSIAFKKNNLTRFNYKKPTNLEFELPWNRLFEAYIDFNLNCEN